MRIRRLDITGFKSFMDRAVFTFDEGMEDAGSEPLGGDAGRVCARLRR